jgi:uncharacterized membrane protein YjfL (UPF0719 family)
LIQFIIALLLAAVSLYIGYTIFSNITKGMDKKELQNRNVAQGSSLPLSFVIAMLSSPGLSGQARPSSGLFYCR